MYFRPDRMAAPVTDLPTYPLSADLGWCDDPGDAAYNQLVRRPYPGRHEQLWREDERYDLLVILTTKSVTRTMHSVVYLQNEIY